MRSRPTQETLPFAIAYSPREPDRAPRRFARGSRIELRPPAVVSPGGDATHARPEVMTGTSFAGMPALLPAPRGDMIETIRGVADRRPGRLGRWLVLASIGLLAAATTTVGVRMWRSAHRVPAPVPAAVATLGADRLELAPDRRSIVRVGRDGSMWTSVQPAAVDTIELAGPFVLGRTSTTVVAVELERGTTTFAWTLPTGEQWSTARPVVVGDCFAAQTIRGADAVIHCLDPATGAPKWSATIAGGQDCAGPPVAITGAYIVQCPGWTTVIHDRTGATSIEAAGVALVQREPPLLLRNPSGTRLVVSSWYPKLRRFNPSGTTVRGTIETPTSAIQRNGRLFVRASSASDTLAMIVQRSGASTVLALPELQLAGDVPLVAECDLGGPPRFQLLVLAPRAGATFDPELARTRVLALVDVDTGRVTWTSRRIMPPRRADAAPVAVCKHGHYVVPLASGLWIVDASTGETRRALGFATGTEASFADLTPEQIGTDEIVGVTGDGPFAIRWREASAALPAGVGDATAELSRELGQLP